MVPMVALDPSYADSLGPVLQDECRSLRQRALIESEYHTFAHAHGMIDSNVVQADWLSRHTATWFHAFGSQALVCGER